MFLSVENINTLLSNKFISENEYRQRFKIKPRYLDVFMTRIGTIGKTNVITTHKPIAYYVSLALLRPQNIQSFFLSFIIQTSKVQQDIWKRTLQIAFPQKINKDEIGKVTLAVPLQKEQIDIEKLLLKLDKLITLQQRKLEQLKQLKKAMLQQLFIDKKSKQPNLRFKIFNGDWEQRKFLDEIDSIIDYRGKTPKKLGMSWSKTGYLALSALNVKNGWIDKKSKDSHFGSQALYDIWMKNTPLYKDQVVFTTEAPMGNVAQIPDNEKYILSQRTIAFNPSQRLIDGFLADLLSTKNIQNKLMSLATGGTAKGVSQKSLKFLKIAFPSNEEQNFIHKVIKLFQILITLQQNKLTQLTTLKKYLLQKLFI